MFFRFVDLLICRFVDLIKLCFSLFLSNDLFIDMDKYYLDEIVKDTCDKIEDVSNVFVSMYKSVYRFFICKSTKKSE